MESFFTKLFLTIQTWNPDAHLMRCKQKRLVCKLTEKRDLARVLPFAEYFVSPLWPYGRVIKNSSGFHGECHLLLVYLGKDVKEANQTMQSLRDQYMYCF